MKKLFIAEKPSVAMQFAEALGGGLKRNGYIESEAYVITWCVGHLVTMSYPERYDKKYKKWSLDTLPFIPESYRYEIIEGVKQQYEIVKSLLTRADIVCIYICTDSGREGEYIYRLVDMMVQPIGKTKKRVWIDSQTREEILRGIKNAKDWSEYNGLAESAFLRAKEDYLMGINFSRVMTLKYGNQIANLLKQENVVLSIGRVMTCVLGMAVRKERDIRAFIKTPYYRVIGRFNKDGNIFEAEWRVQPQSRYFHSPKLYKENGFKDKKDAQALIQSILPYTNGMNHAKVISLEKKIEKKNPPPLYNLAELQSECAKRFKISPDETLKIAQELYEKKMITYPRTDARVLSTTVAKEILTHLKGLYRIESLKDFVKYILDTEVYKKIMTSRYVNDSQITDHYAIIPTGQGISIKLSPLSIKVYDIIVRRFLCIFYPPAIYEKYLAEIVVEKEHFFANLKVCKDLGYLIVQTVKNKEKKEISQEEESKSDGLGHFEIIKELKKGMEVSFQEAYIKAGETTAPKRYSSGSMILAMENAGQLIEDEDLRSQIKGSGIGTSATRAEILKKLINIKYLFLNKKTQIIMPTLLGEMVFEAVFTSMKQLLNPELTASWEKGLRYVSEGRITSDEYIEKLNRFVIARTEFVRNKNDSDILKQIYNQIKIYYIKQEK